MNNNYKFFNHKCCEYMPCHKGIKKEELNCLFCYCPLNQYEDCPGTPKYIKDSVGNVIKDCSECTFPHRPENYDKVIEFIMKKNRQ